MKINLYNTNIQRGHYIDNIYDYLDKCEKLYVESSADYVCKDFQEDNLTITLKVLQDDVLKTMKGYDYLICYDSTKTRYYFINSIKYLNEGTVIIQGDLDVINSFQNYVSNENNFKQVKMKRMHKDRFNSMGIRKFDTVDEGFEPDVEGTLSSAVGDNNRSYIVYKQDTTTDSGYVKSPSSQLRKLWYPETSQTVTIDQYKIDTTWTFEYVTSSGTKYLVVDGNLKVAVSGPTTQYCPRLLLLSPSGLTVRINKPNYNQFSIFCDAILIYPSSITTTGKLEARYFKYDNGYLTYISGDTYDSASSYHLQIYGLEDWSAYIDYYNTSGYPSLTAGKKYLINELCQQAALSTIGASSVTPTATSLSMVNKSNSELKQITEIPFIPGSSSLCYLGGDNNEIAVKANIDLLSKSGQEITIAEWQKVTIPTDRFITREKKYESKLYGSYCRNYYLNYDNNTLVLQPERWQNTTPKVTSYAPCDYSNNLGFKVLGFNNKSEYDNWLLCSRNNNIQIYNDDYLEYIRTGYNYDVKNKQQQSVKNWVSFGLGVASSAVGLGVAAKGSSVKGLAGVLWNQGTGLATSSINALTSNIISEVSNQQALDQRKQQAMNATVNISGNDNLALFHQYNISTGLRFNKTIPHTYVEDTEYDLFYYFGYADNRTFTTMPKYDSRTYFNYVQCDISNPQSNDYVSQDIINAIVEQFSNGVTFEWEYVVNDKSTWLCEGTLYENWETNI